MAIFDAHGQPIPLFRFNQLNNYHKAIDQLSGLCVGILADGVVSDAEAVQFAEWVRQYAAMEPVWPFTDILARVNRIFADGVCDEEERAELKAVMEALTGHNETTETGQAYSTTLPLDSPLPSQIIFPNREFVVTGRFAYGTRERVFETIVNLGGLPTSSSPTRKTHYLVVGVFASRDWANTNYGRKIERAVELRKQGTGLSIISEEHWNQFVLS
jgi:NAD-dependent DNA ligase